MKTDDLGNEVYFGYVLVRRGKQYAVTSPAGRDVTPEPMPTSREAARAHVKALREQFQRQENTECVNGECRHVPSIHTPSGCKVAGCECRLDIGEAQDDAADITLDDDVEISEPEAVIERALTTVLGTGRTVTRPKAEDDRRVYFRLDGGIAQGVIVTPSDSNGHVVFVTHSQKSPRRVGTYLTTEADQRLTEAEVAAIRATTIERRKTREKKRRRTEPSWFPKKRRRAA